MRHVIFVVMLLAGCSADPHDYVIPPDPETWASDTGLVESIKKLPEEDRKSIEAYLTRKLFARSFWGEGVPPTGISIEDALAEQQEWEAEREEHTALAEKVRAEREEHTALAEKVRAEREEQIADLQKAVTVVVIGKELQESGFSKVITLDVAFENHGDKEISGVKGILHFNDMFGDKIKSIRLSYGDGIPVGGTATWDGGVRYNPFMDADVKMAGTTLDKMEVVWEPEMVVYADGDKLSVPDQ